MRTGHELVLGGAGSGNPGNRPGFWLVTVKPVGSIATQLDPVSGFLQACTGFFLLDLPLKLLCAKAHNGLNHMTSFSNWT